MTETSTLQSDLARARGLGASHHGSAHWIHERLTALANIPLVLWLVYSILHLKGAPHHVVASWLTHPLNAILTLLFIFSVFYHTLLGLQVITEDYIHRGSTKFFLLTGFKFALIALGVACAFAVLKVAVGG